MIARLTIIYQCIFLISLSLNACKEKPDLNEIAKRELSSGERNNNLLFGIQFGMSNKQVDSIINVSQYFFSGKDLLGDRKGSFIGCDFFNERDSFYHPILANITTHYYNERLSQFHLIFPTESNLTDAYRLRAKLVNDFGPAKT